MKGFVIVNPEVLVARRIERTGQAAPALEIIRWRLEQLELETIVEAHFWDVLPCDVALTRAVRLAKAREAYHPPSAYHGEAPGIIQAETRIDAAGAKVGSQ